MISTGDEKSKSFSIFVQGLTMTPVLRKMGEMPLPDNNEDPSRDHP